MFPTDADEPSPPAPAPRSGPRGPSALRGDRLGDPATEAAAAPKAPSSTPNAMGLLKALQRRWALALTTGVLAAAAAAGIAWLVVPPAKYSTQAMLRINSQVPHIIFNTKETQADYEIYRTTQVALIKSNKVLTAALDTPASTTAPAVAQLKSIREQADPIDWLRKQITVETARGSEIFFIGMSGDRKEELAVLVNAVTDAYQDVIVRQEDGRRQSRMDKLNQLYISYQKSLKDRREKLRDLAGRVGSDERSSLAYNQQLLLGQLDAAKTRLAEVQSKLRDINAALASRKQKAQLRGTVEATTPSAAAVAEAMRDEPVIVQGLVKLDQLRERYDRVKKRVRNPNDPALQAVARDYQAARKALEAERLRLRPAVLKRLQGTTRADALLVSIQDLQDEADIQRRIRDLAEQDANRLQAELKEFNQGFIDVQEKKDEIAHEEAAARQVGEEIQAMKVEINAPARVELVDRAEMPTTRDEYRPAKAAGSAAAAAFGLVLMAVSLWEYRARRIDTVDEVVQGLGMRLVGALPALPEPVRRRAVGAETAADRRWQSLLVESVDATRTMLLHASRAEGLQVVMVTSAVKGEGKTSLAGHLAMSLARAGRATLLVDCDLRSPAAHRLFDLPLEPGLCEVLRGEAEAADAIRPTPASELDVIPAGRCDAQALRALALDGLGQLFAELKVRYDFIIVDSAPVLPVVDSLLVSQYVDAVLFSILREVSRMPEVHAAHERLASLGVRLLGAVVTGTQAQHHYYYADYHNAGRAGA